VRDSSSARVVVIRTRGQGRLKGFPDLYIRGESSG